MAKVIGLGGVFIKFNDPLKMREWYRDVLGMTTNAYGVLFEFGPRSNTGYLQLGTFDATTDYFGDKNQHYMLNFRVLNLVGLETKLRASGVTIVDSIEEYSYGKFLHILDPEGNRLELWEPVDSEFSANDEPKMSQN